MRFAGPFILCLAAVSLPAFAAQADTLAMTDNPYSGISERNIFALVPIPTNAPVVDTPPVDPPPKITPNGTMTLFGKLEVLYKVTPKPVPGQQPKEESYVMAEGERENDITVIKIDNVAGIITFNNHGIIQELPLADAPKLTTPAAVGGGPGMNPMPGGIPMPTLPLGMAPGVIGRGLRGRGAVGSPLSSAPASTPSDAAATPTTGTTEATAQPKTIEDQVLNAAKEMAVIEQNRIATQELVDQGKMPPLPPTMLTPADATAHDGMPLLAPSEPVVPPKGK